jgi:phosphatidylinositol-bisphosphatase
MRQGNKGGVAIAFNVFDTSFCFVDSHLAARLDEVSRRNQDYHDLIKRFLFLTSGECPDLDDFRELFDYEYVLL